MYLIQSSLPINPANTVCVAYFRSWRIYKEHTGISSFYLTFIQCLIEKRIKDLSLSHKLWFSNPYIWATQYCRPWIFQTMNSVRSNNIRLTCQRCTLQGFKDIGIRIFDFGAKTQFLCFFIFVRKIKSRGDTRSQSHLLLLSLYHHMHKVHIIFRRYKGMHKDYM